MAIKTELICPLGSQCEKIVDDTIKRCVWFMEIAGVNPTTGETIDDKGCAMVWLPVLLVENSRQQKSTAAAVESFRNEMVESNAMSQQLLIAKKVIMDS
jgi:hypothetical protein